MSLAPSTPLAQRHFPARFIPSMVYASLCTALTVAIFFAVAVWIEIYDDGPPGSGGGAP